jgi:CubicO group peptidase (beta-lactamase class C family)
VTSTDDAVTRALDEARALGELGVQVAAYRHGELMVDSWTGDADPVTGRPVDGSTLFSIFSVTKAVTATALHVQAARGRVAYDAPVARYWPEFGRHGKDAITVHDVLTHRAGIPQMPEGVTIPLMCDWEWMVEQIAASTPLFPPGERSAYHSLVFGWLVGELVRRTDPSARPFSQFVGEEITGPLAIEDLWFGVPTEHTARVAVLVSDDSSPGDRGDLAGRAMPTAVAPSPKTHNDPRVRAACLPGAGVIATARSTARFFAMLANEGELDGVRLLPADHVRWLTTPRARPDEVDAVLAGSVNAVPAISMGGFRLSDPVAGDGPGVLCHPGSGGSIGWADLHTGLAGAICHNRMFAVRAGVRHPFASLGDALRSVAASAGPAAASQPHGPVR